MIAHEFQGCHFECFTKAEFAEAGMKKTHRQVSNSFTSGEGPLLERWIKQFGEGAVLVSNGKARPRITVYAPKREKKRAARRKISCGSGAARLEGLTGNIDDHWAFYDVLAACTKKLRQWEEEGVIEVTIRHCFPAQYF